MAVRAVDMVRKIRDQHYEDTKDLPVEEQIELMNKKSTQLQKFFQGIPPSTPGHIVTQSPDV